jgi:hypothetical protein
MDALSELEQVKAEIVAIKADLAQGKRDGLPINDPGIVALRNELIRLYDEKARLQPPTSGQFFGIKSEMHKTRHGIMCPCCFLLLLLYFVVSFDPLHFPPGTITAGECITILM